MRYRTAFDVGSDGKSITVRADGSRLRRWGVRIVVVTETATQAGRTRARFASATATADIVAGRQVTPTVEQGPIDRPEVPTETQGSLGDPRPVFRWRGDKVCPPHLSLAFRPVAVLPSPIRHPRDRRSCGCARKFCPGELQLAGAISDRTYGRNKRCAALCSA